MNLMTITAYAASHNAQRQAAAKWADKGALVMVGGQVDAQASDTRMKAFGLGRFRSRGHGGRRNAGVRGKTDRPAISPALPSSIPSETAMRGRFDPLEGLSPEEVQWRQDNPLSLGVQIAAATIALDCADTDEEVAGSAGTLLDLADVITFWEMQQRADDAGWLPWAREIAPSMATEMSVPADRLVSAIEAAVVRRLVGLGHDEAELRAAH